MHDKTKPYLYVTGLDQTAHRYLQDNKNVNNGPIDLKYHKISSKT